MNQTLSCFVCNTLTELSGKHSIIYRRAKLICSRAMNICRAARSSQAGPIDHLPRKSQLLITKPRIVNHFSRLPLPGLCGFNFQDAIIIMAVRCSTVGSLRGCEVACSASDRRGPYSRTSYDIS